MSLISLFKAFTENKIILAEKLPSNNNPTDRIMAQVKALQDIYALLNSQEKGDFWARVNSPVKVGEYLLLQFIKIQDGKPYYRILKRFAGRLKLNEGKNISYLRLFIEGQEALIPVILRDFSDSEEEIGRNGKKPATTVCNWRMDFVVKTSNLGLIIIQFMKRDNIYYSQLLVESEKTGHALESELGELRTLTKDLKERNVILFKVGLITGPLKRGDSSSITGKGYQVGYTGLKEAVYLLNDYKKIKRAVALRYQQEKDRAPVVTAKGQGRVAEKIISLAEEHDIPVEKNSLLAYELFKLELNQEIPVELYEAVAIILTAIYQCDQKAKNT